LLALACFGALLGALVNALADRVRWEPSLVDPWHPPRPGIRRRRAHYLPIWGWLSRHEERVHFGPRFWLRPVLIEVLCAAGLPALYWHETVALALFPRAFGEPTALPAVTHAIFLSHAILVTLMLVASLVDIDERIIPDSVTIPGTLLGLLLAGLLPHSLLPEVVADGELAVLRPLSLASPLPFPAGLAGRPQSLGLAVGLAALWIWCAGLMPRTLRLKRGLGVALALFWSRLRGQIVTLYLVLLGLAGSIGIVSVWWQGGTHWQGLLTALVGMAVTGGITWLVRFVASTSIGREALGFGDVTLMAMIGAFLGWQAGLIVFFVAPFFGLVLGFAQWFIHRNSEIPYGPFLCLAALAVMLCWAPIWEFAAGIFLLGGIVVVILVCGVLLMGVMLRAWHWLIGR
jgi:prepilin signal peptidase PulO-like enzyme (type II secretory pathway)